MHPAYAGELLVATFLHESAVPCVSAGGHGLSCGPASREQRVGALITRSFPTASDVTTSSRAPSSTGGEDLRDVDPQAVRDVRVERTYVGGDAVYRAP